MNKLDARLRAYILHSLCEGMSQRSCERIFGVGQNTVARLLRDAGDMAIAHLATISDLTIEKIQADELHSFVAARAFNVADMAVPDDDAGTIWTYLAVCARSKLIVSYHLGDQTVDDATIFAKRIAATLKRRPDGDFVLRPTIITDGLKAYPEAMDNGFGSDLNFGVLTKQYTAKNKDGKKLPYKRYKGSHRGVVKGKVNERDIGTSYVERQNLNVRMQNRRYGRKTNAFSKKMLNHERHLALWIMYHNYCWIPRPQRPHGPPSPPGTPMRERTRWILRDTAAITAGVTRSVFEIKDLLKLTDEFVAARRAAEAEVVVEPEVQVVAVDDVELAPSHWVYWSHQYRSTKVHEAGCVNCRDGSGKKGGGATKSGDWHPFYCLEDATAAAEAMSPNRHSICSMCIAEYRRMGRRL